MKKVLQFIIKKFKKWIEEPIKKPEWYKEAKRIVDKDIAFSIVGKNKLSKREAEYIIRAEKVLDEEARKFFFSLPLHRVIPLSKRILIKKLIKTA